MAKKKTLAAPLQALTDDDVVTAFVHRCKQRDPDVLADLLERLETSIVRADAVRRLGLGLDLGTSCGYCLSWFVPGVPYAPAAAYTVMGQLNLESGAYDSGAIRLVRLRQFLGVVRPDILFYEDVRYTPVETPNRFNANAIVARAAKPMEWFGALKGCIGAWAEEHGAPCQGYPIGTIKKRASGAGNAGKPAVIAGVNSLFGVDLDPAGWETSGDDNIADAAACLLLGLEQHALGVA
jgi:hypothetical protein